MAKTNFFCVAVEGPTVDGRTIERKHIEQMAASYDPATYTARINVEHLRGYSPQPPFNAYGSVSAVETREITVNMAGKQEKKLALFASFDVNDQAKELTKADQKIFSSVEIQPNFAETGKAYLVGIAFTDSPASLATEALKFSTRDDKRKDNLLGVEDTGFTLEFTEDTSGGADEMAQAGNFLKKLFSGLMTGAQAEAETQPIPPKKANAGDADQFTAMATAMEQGFAKMTESIAASFAKQDARIGKVTQDLTALKTDLEKTPDRRNHSARPAATGGGDRTLADC